MRTSSPGNSVARSEPPDGMPPKTASIHAGANTGLFADRADDIERGLPILLVFLIFSGGHRIVRLLFVITVAGMIGAH